LETVWGIRTWQASILSVVTGSIRLVWIPILIKDFSCALHGGNVLHEIFSALIDDVGKQALN
jgi:hypothetical protein